MNLPQARFTCMIIIFAVSLGSQKFLTSHRRYYKFRKGDTASITILQLLHLLMEK